MKDKRNSKCNNAQNINEKLATHRKDTEYGMRTNNNNKIIKNILGIIHQHLRTLGHLFKSILIYIKLQY